MRTALCDPQGLQLGSSGTGFFGCSCLPKAVTGVSQPGVGLESAYSGPRVELRPPVYPSPVVRADLVLVGAVHLGGGGSQRRHGYRVGDCSAEGGTRLGCVRGALGSICFITRLALIPLLHAVPSTVVPSVLPPPLPPHPPSRIYRGEGRGVLLRILVWNAYVSCIHGGVVPACSPPWPK